MEFNFTRDWLLWAIKNEPDHGECEAGYAGAQPEPVVLHDSDEFEVTNQMMFAGVDEIAKTLRADRSQNPGRDFITLDEARRCYRVMRALAPKKEK